MLKISKDNEQNDTLILDFLSKVGYCQEQHIFKLFESCGIEGNDQKIVRKCIARLAKKELVVKLSYLQGQGYFILLTKTGAKPYGINPAKKLILNTLNHDLILLDLLLCLKGKYPNSVIQTDREIKRKQGLVGVGVAKVPDLLIDNNIAIELELTAKTETRLREIINTYILNPDIHQVHYYAKSAAILNRVFKLAKISPKFKGFLFKGDVTQAQEILSLHMSLSSSVGVEEQYDSSFDIEAEAVDCSVVGAKATQTPRYNAVGMFNLDDYLS